MTFDYSNHDYSKGYMSEKTKLPTDRRFIEKEHNRFTLNYDNNGFKSNILYHKVSS